MHELRERNLPRQLGAVVLLDLSRGHVLGCRCWELHFLRRWHLSVGVGPRELLIMPRRSVLRCRCGRMHELRERHLLGRWVRIMYELLDRHIPEQHWTNIMLDLCRRVDLDRRRWKLHELSCWQLSTFVRHVELQLLFCGNVLRCWRDRLHELRSRIDRRVGIERVLRELRRW